MLKIMTPISFTIIFESTPVWLYCLDPSRCSQLCFPNFNSVEHLLSSLQERGIDTKVVQRTLLRFGSRKLLFATDVDSSLSRESTYLLSGRVSFLLPHLRNPTVRMISVCDHHYVGRIRNQRPNGVPLQGLSHVSWHRVRHVSVGGATLFCSLFGVTIANIDPMVTSIRRTIKHFLNHSIRPKPCPSPVTTSIISWLHPDALDTPICYQTSFTATGWGHRPLTGDELWTVYGLPSRLRMGGLDSADIKGMVPAAQVLDSILLPAIQVLSSSVLPGSDMPTPRIFANVQEADRTWLPLLSLFLPHSWVDTSLVTDKAAKRDDAGIPSSLWDLRITLLFPGLAEFLPWLRDRLLRIQRRRLLREFRSYLLRTYGGSWHTRLTTYRSLISKGCLQHHQGGINSITSDVIQQHSDATVGADVLSKLANSTWWQWDAGSTLIFWRWGSNASLARDGFPPYISGPLPTYRTPARRPKAFKLPLIIPKLQLILDRKYVIPGTIHSLTDYFDVPKADDSRLIYNGTSCGLNDSLWAPTFWLPTAKTALRSLDFNYHSVDMDLGDMFLNFPLHKKLQGHSGIDLTPYKLQLGFTNPGRFWVHWTRCWMGAKPSPFCAVAFYYLAEEFIKGNRTDPRNPLRWDDIILNLPGDPSFNPSKPRVMKWDSVLKLIAGDINAFVDDLRASGYSIEHAWKVARAAASRLQYLGCQDAARKRRPPTKSPGAWAGAVFETSDSSVVKLVSQEKWDKAKGLVATLCMQCKDEGTNTLLNYKELERTRGFLVHLAMTYEVFGHHLKGFHLTLASYWNKRDSDGWKLNDNDWHYFLQSKLEDYNLSPVEAEKLLDNTDPKPPTVIKPVPQLIDDLYVLTAFLASECPPEVEDQKAEVRFLLYGFADASGGGLGSSVLVPGTGIRCRTGVWGKDEEDTSSNFKEFSNVVITVEHEAVEGTLKGALMFLFTDNSTVEGALYKGNTPSRKLFELIVRLRKVQLENATTILVSHVAGKRMVAQGTDGISRGELKEGISEGNPMLSFIPLHLSAVQRHPPIVDWIKSWTQTDIELLSPKDWFTRGHDHDGGHYDPQGFWRINTRPGIFVWSPPPAAADVALEELRKALIKRQNSTHMFICPRLLTCEWRHQLHKAADLVVFLPSGSDGWPDTMYEPLTIGFVFPFLSYSPWQLRGTPKMLQLGREMPKNASGVGHGPTGYFAQIFPSVQVITLHAGACGAADAILRTTR